MARKAKGPQVEVNGHIFTKDAKTGYYLSAQPIYEGKRIRLHRYVWMLNNGEIPKGMAVHHIDENKDNNDISNLILLYQSKHSEIHMEEIMSNHLDERKQKFMEFAHPAAVNWHKSEKGREWHKKQWEKSLKPTIDAKGTKNCAVCGAEYEVPLSRFDKSLFCSKKCKAKHRRDSGIDDVSKTCVVCGTPFESNKYENVITCSKKCAARIIVSRRESKKNG